MSSLRFIAALVTLAIGATRAHAALEYDFVYVDAFQTDYSLRESYLFDLNESGEACGWATDVASSFNYAGFHWARTSEKSRIPFASARGINDSGRIAGLNLVYDFATGDLDTIASVPGALGRPVALDLNDRGVVVGYAETCICSNSNRLHQIPFVWDPEHGSRSIPVPGAKELLKINNADQAVGNIRGTVRDGFVYDIATGALTLLSGFLPPTTYPSTEAADINDLGWVTGVHRDEDPLVQHGFVWPASGGARLLPHLGGNSRNDVRPAAINRDGVVVGSAEIGDLVWRAFLWDSVSGIRDLNELAIAPAGFVMARALEINDRGWIVGDGYQGPTWSPSRAFVLIPKSSSPTLDVAGAASSLALALQPNPARGTTAIHYSLPTAAPVTIEILDLGGRRVASLSAPSAPAGRHLAHWDGHDLEGRAVPAGFYVVRIQAAGKKTAKTLAIVR